MTVFIEQRLALPGRPITNAVNNWCKLNRVLMNEVSIEINYISCYIFYNLLNKFGNFFKDLEKNKLYTFFL